jgi:hypothetical protein
VYIEIGRYNMVNEQQLRAALEDKSIVKKYYPLLNQVVPYHLARACNGHDPLNITQLLQQDQARFYAYADDKSGYKKMPPLELHAQMLEDFKETFERIEKAKTELLAFEAKVKEIKAKFIELFGN